MLDAPAERVNLAMQHRLVRAAFVTVTSLSPIAACGPAAEAPPAVESCPADAPSTTVEHVGSVAQTERWSAASTHLVRGDLALAAGVTLTIEPCARVTFATGASLTAARAGSRIVAEGAAQRPITFDGASGARWSQIAIEHPATASLRYARLARGGGDRFHGYATIALRGDGNTPAKPVAALEHVTIESSLGPGVRVERAGTFAPSSTDLTIRASGGDEVPFAMAIGEHALDAVPTGAYTGNRVDELLVTPEGANGRGGLQQDSTMRDRGVPYRIGDSPVARLSIGAGGSDAPSRTTLTIEPGVVMRFHPGTQLAIERATGEFAASGVLRAVGTAARPIVMTSAAATPRAGDWVGLWYGGIPSADNRLEHVAIEYTGHDCGCVLATCSDVERNDSAVIFTAPPPTAFVRNTRFAHGSGHGIFRGWRGNASPDFMESNTFEDLGGCAQTLPYLTNGCGALQACR